MAICLGIARSAAWPIFFVSPADRLTRRRATVGTSLRLFCRKRAPKRRTQSAAGLANDPEEPRLSVSVGIAVYPENGTTIESLFQAADSALYKMKHLENRA